MAESSSDIALRRLRFAMEEQPKREEIGVVLNTAEKKALDMIRRGGDSARRGKLLLSQVEAARRLLVKD